MASAGGAHPERVRSDLLGARFRQRDRHKTVSVTRGDPVNPAEGMSISVNEIVSLPRVWVPRGQGIQVAATLGANAGGGGDHFFNYGGVHANFSDSFHFDPLHVFQIDQPGITVNSPSLGLENNTLPAAIPLSAAVWCLLSGLAAMPLARRRKRLA